MKGRRLALAILMIVVLLQGVRTGTEARAASLREQLAGSAVAAPSPPQVAEQSETPAVDAENPGDDESSDSLSGSGRVSGLAAPVAGGGGGGEAVPCPCCGIIWHADNQENGETHGESPIGGLEETCWIVGQVWTDRLTTERWTFAIRPGTVVWFRGHRGGTAWLFAGTEEGAVWENIKLQARQLEERDGPMQTGILMLPDQANLMRIIVKIQ